MIKAVSLRLAFLFLFGASTLLRAQTANPTTVVAGANGMTASGMAVNQAILDQANTIVLRQKIVEAKSAAARGDLPKAAKLYEDAKRLVDQIGSGIDVETAQTISGLVAVRMELARQAQKNGDLLEADGQVTRVLNVDPQNPEAIAFKRNNDAILAANKGKMPDAATLEKLPQINAEKTDSDTFVQNGKLLYEAGKFEEAEVQLNQALKLDPDNDAAIYYLKLIKQAYYARGENLRVIDQQNSMLEVSTAWRQKQGLTLPVPNPYVTNTDIHTGVGRERIYNKLNKIRLDNVAWNEGRPLSEVISYLSDQSKLRDPDKKGVNFVFNPNQESSGTAPGAPASAPTQIDPATGQPILAPGAGGAASEPVDPTTIHIALNLSDVSLQDLLDMIVLVADKPIRYSVNDVGVIFSTKPSGPEPPDLQMRVFRVDPNTFYQGLQSVGSFTFGSANNNSSGSGGSSGGSSGGNSGGSSGGGNGGSGSISGAIVPVVNVAGGGGGGGGGNGGNGGGRGGNGGTGGTGGGGGGGGINAITAVQQMQDVSTAAKTFFQAVGVDLTVAGRSIAFNDRLGLLFVKASPGELDTIERTIQALNQVAPQVHVKARFIEVQQSDNAALGFDWYLGNFINGNVVANGGSAPSLSVPVSAANPLGAFPGNTAASLIPPSATDQSITQGLRNSGPALATITGILTDPNFRVVLHALQQRDGVETLAEPEVTTISGRQTQMRATDIQYILTGFGTSQTVGGVGGGTTGP